MGYGNFVFIGLIAQVLPAQWLNQCYQIIAFIYLMRDSYVVLAYKIAGTISNKFNIKFFYSIIIDKFFKRIYAPFIRSPSKISCYLYTHRLANLITVNKQIPLILIFISYNSYA